MLPSKPQMQSTLLDTASIMAVTVPSEVDQRRYMIHENGAEVNDNCPLSQNNIIILMSTIQKGQSGANKRACWLFDY